MRKKRDGENSENLLITGFLRRSRVIPEPDCLSRWLSLERLHWCVVDRFRDAICDGLVDSGEDGDCGERERI